MLTTVDYRIRGLDCAEEVAALRAELDGRDGVLGLDFNVIHARMTVRYDPAVITEADIIAAVGATGMSAEPWTSQAPTAEGFWLRRGRAVMTALSGLLLAAGFVAHWAMHGDVMHALSAGDGDGHRLGPLVMLLYGGAVLAGAWFVVGRATLSARRLRADMNLLMMIAVAGAIIIGEWFEAATVAFLFSLALLLEQWSVGRARRAIGQLLDIAPPVVTLLDEAGRHTSTPVGAGRGGGPDAGSAGRAGGA